MNSGFFVQCLMQYFCKLFSVCASPYIHNFQYIKSNDNIYHDKSSTVKYRAICPVLLPDILPLPEFFLPMRKAAFVGFYRTALWVIFMQETQFCFLDLLHCGLFLPFAFLLGLLVREVRLFVRPVSDAHRTLLN